MVKPARQSSHLFFPRLLVATGHNNLSLYFWRPHLQLNSLTLIFPAKRRQFKCESQASNEMLDNNIMSATFLQFSFFFFLTRSSNFVSNCSVNETFGTMKTGTHFCDFRDFINAFNSRRSEIFSPLVKRWKQNQNEEKKEKLEKFRLSGRRHKMTSSPVPSKKHVQFQPSNIWPAFMRIVLSLLSVAVVSRSAYYNANELMNGKRKKSVLWFAERMPFAALMCGYCVLKALRANKSSPFHFIDLKIRFGFTIEFMW